MSGSPSFRDRLVLRSLSVSPGRAAPLAGRRLADRLVRLAAVEQRYDDAPRAAGHRDDRFLGPASLLEPLVQQTPAVPWCCTAPDQRDLEAWDRNPPLRGVLGAYSRFRRFDCDGTVPMWPRNFRTSEKFERAGRPVQPVAAVAKSVPEKGPAPPNNRSGPAIAARLI